MANWQVTGYYAGDVKPPKKPGELACSVRCLGDSTRDMELSVFRSREDVGEVEVRELPWNATLTSRH